MRVPKHIGVIPDGNRRWAANLGLNKAEGYDKGLDPGLQLYHLCKEVGVKEITYYGFTMDNTKRPALQRKAFTAACINAVKMLAKKDANLLVVGNSDSPMFPKELIPYTKRTKFGKGTIKVNFLVNYGWHWDLGKLTTEESALKSNSYKGLHSSDVSRIDLIIRWGGRRRLSGFLPAQAVYADFYIIDDYWPDFKPQHFYDALEWYRGQDITLGG
ncbi:undecaprenyl diphosphate synthase family protein [Alkaliphilus serpentinus]|uniref:Undecaprenyl diphosphate synthase family protein n=1 Tax=Alkaliphilus serpentinus TaxID=1482731 RepID=A0A833MDN2_9FIRM|nr:undecaprenyl diphosphate synthase family protein [Alkaliphilus serpentinus]KAB3529205.1 undecaprenyl diphosphate synthase family protein [Alkaliphilus serpentinus]